MSVQDGNTVETTKVWCCSSLPYSPNLVHPKPCLLFADILDKIYLNLCCQTYDYAVLPNFSHAKLLLLTVGNSSLFSQIWIISLVMYSNDQISYIKCC